MVLTSSPGVCAARLRGGGWGRTAGSLKCGHHENRGVRACPHSSLDMHVGASTQPQGTLDEGACRQRYGETVHHRTIDHAKTVGSDRIAESAKSKQKRRPGAPYAAETALEYGHISEDRDETGEPGKWCGIPAPSSPFPHRRTLGSPMGVARSTNALIACS